MGEVYRAHDNRLGRDVAIKILPTQIAHDTDRRARFEREARAIAALTHPNILAIHDVGTHAGTTYLVTELLEGETLRQRFGAGAIAPRKAIEIGIQIAGGLAAAHDKGIVHRDLKPENVFITRDGRVKILDFGLAAQNVSDASTAEAPTIAARTEAGVVLGTVGYMSPEQVRGTKVDHRTDIFALGTVLFEMLTGRRAFQRDTSAETMPAILRDDVPELSSTARQSRRRSSGSCADASKRILTSGCSTRETSQSRSKQSPALISQACRRRTRPQRPGRGASLLRPRHCSPRASLSDCWPPRFASRSTRHSSCRASCH